MRLSCSHCTRYDAEPLTAIPARWCDVVPLHERFITTANTIVTHLGCCPVCDELRKTAFVVPIGEPERAAMQGRMF